MERPADNRESLDYLVQQLQAATETPAHAPPPGQPPMQRTLQRVRLAFGTGRDLAATPRATRAMLAFRSGQKLSFVDLKYLCHGAQRPNPWDGRRLLDDTGLLARLLQEVERWSVQPRRFRQCYRGLLLALEQMAGKGLAGEFLLRDFLQRHRQAVVQSRPALAWTRTLAKQPEA